MPIRGRGLSLIAQEGQNALGAWMDYGAAQEIGQTRAIAMTAQLRQAIGLLRLRNQDIAEQAAVLAAGNAHLVLVRSTVAQQPDTWLDLIRVIAPPDPTDPQRGTGAATHQRAGTGGDGGADAGAALAAAAPGLLAHVGAQIGLLLRDPRDRPVAQAYLEALEPSGWLVCGPEAVARATGCSLMRAEAVLTQLQQAEPAGLFARSLSECLRLQAADRGLLTPGFACLLDNLPLVAAGDLQALAVQCGSDPDAVGAMIRSLRTLNPKPGAAFGDVIAPIGAPDLIVLPDGGGWLVELNRSTLPAVRVEAAPAQGGSAAALLAATAFERALHRRNATTLRVAAEVVARQTGFVTGGAGRLGPLSLDEIAAATGLHRSTISRVTADLMVALPRATVRFRDFFSAALNRQGDRVATAAVLERLREMIATEDRSAPLSDHEIARRFGAEGIVLARRTVAKYRGLLGLAESRQRRGVAVRGGRAACVKNSTRA